MSDTPISTGRSGLSGFSAHIEHVFEHFLWYFRLVIVLGVVGLLMGSSVVFILGILETTHLVGNFFATLWMNHLHLAEETGHGLLTYNELIMSVIKIVDDFLVGIVLLIFGLGSYDLFISRIDPALSQTDIRPDWLIFGSLEELKGVLGKVVLMILTITFLQVCINMEFSTPLDLIYLGAGIAFVSLGLKLTHGKDINRTTAETVAANGTEKR
jgi:uncharacterized membrane protein YqhA